MKKTIGFSALFFLTFLLSAVTSSAQETKIEKKVKIVVSDGSGTKVVIDTVMNNNSKTLTVISADSLDVSGGPERVVIIRNDEGKGDGKHDTLYVVKSDGHSGKKGKGNVFYYKNEDNSSKKSNDEKFDVFIDRKDADNMSDEKVKYVIAKNGMVVTVEGNDEEKAKELFNEIEKKLDEITVSKGKNEPAKTVTSKPAKK